jgi:hypothetical protein
MLYINFPSITENKRLYMLDMVTIYHGIVPFATLHSVQLFRIYRFCYISRLTEVKDSCTLLQMHFKQNRVGVFNTVSEHSSVWDPLQSFAQFPNNLVYYARYWLRFVAFGFPYNIC